MTFSMLIASGLLAVQPYEMLKIQTAGTEVIVGRHPADDVYSTILWQHSGEASIRWNSWPGPSPGTCQRD